MTRQDVANLLGWCGHPDDDDALLVPQLGRPRSGGEAEQPQPPLHLPAAGTPGRAAGALGGSSGRGGSGMLAAQAAAAEDDDGQEVRRGCWRLAACGCFA